MDVATLIILIVVGGVILWGALTDWTFSGIFDGRGGAERDSPPGPISDVQLEVATGESGGRRESYTTLDEMKGLSITVSFNTPKSSFGYGDLTLKDYVISLGTADSNTPRKDLLAVIVIPRTNATNNTRLIAGTNDTIIGPEDITLSGNFNATDTRVSITLSDSVWTAGGIILPAGDVFLGIDYTPKEAAGDPYKSNDVKAATPAGNYTKYFIPGGVTLSGTIQDGGVFVVNPDVTETINEELDIAMGSGDISGELYIRKQIGNESRFLISPADNTNIYLRTLLGEQNERGAIVVSILAEPQDKCRLNKFHAMPTRATASFTEEFLNGIPVDDFLGPESNWFNFAVIEEHPTGWVRLGLISNFEKADETGSKIKLADFPVIHPVHQMVPDHNFLSFHTYNIINAATKHHKTYFRFVSPLDSRYNPNSEEFSLCVRRVHNNVVDSVLNIPLLADDLFLTRNIGTDSAELKRLKDITNFSDAVFTKRNPDSSPPASVTYTYTRDRDRPGHDIDLTTYDVNVNRGTCQSQCDNKNDCVGYSYSDFYNSCYLKKAGVMGEDLVYNGFTFYKKNT